MKMKRWAASFAVLLALTSVTKAGEPWQEFKSRAGRFAVSLPGVPQEQTMKSPTPLGDVEIHFFVLQHSRAPLGVMYSDYPGKEVTAGSAELALDSARDSAVAETQGKLRSEERIVFSGNPGRDLVIDAPGGLTIRSRLIVVNKRLYQLFAGMEKGQENDAQIVKMLNSFRLLDE